MGLDMYAMTTKEKFEHEADCVPEDATGIHYWHSHPDLHGWMADLYYEKGGADWMFNGVTVCLNADDLDVLEAHIRAQILPKTTGFFFGESDETMMEDDLEFVKTARKAISEGYSVLYTSSW